ncbi:uncharacterized protein LOC128398236 [Panonychus citri]|uniref:uncharacterized protein LOC128398236 n=1 Tax=Panonychus citri TaxID=50023 RepID=UPI002306EBF2|nr:uncharacterized protein LOC128398236 [Panonychus citri]
MELILSSVYLLFILIQFIQCDPHHPHLMRHHEPPTNMTELCNRHKWHLEMHHRRHLFDLKYRTCMSQVSLEKYKQRENQCLSIMDPKDIGYCLAPENHQSKFESLKKCLDETKLTEEEWSKLADCMGYRKTQSKRRKRDIRWYLSRMNNISEVCDFNMIGYYLNHPSHFEAHHACTLKVIGNDRVGKRIQCHAKYPIKSLNDFHEKCKSPEDHKEEFDSGTECFKQNMITHDEKIVILSCTFKALGDLDQEYALQALLYKPFKDLDEFCIKSRNYWHDEEELYKDRFEACSMKNYPAKTEARWACETFDKFDQTSVDKCIEKQDAEFKTMITCFGSNEYTPEEEETIKTCLADSQVEWKGVPKIPSTIEDACVYTLFRWFGFNPVYYRYVNECMKEKWTPEEYNNFECGNILTIKTNDQLTEACKSPNEEHKASYLKFRECREANEPPLEKIKDAFDCSMNKMIDHVNDMKKEEDEDEDEATSD